MEILILETGSKTEEKDKEFSGMVPLEKLIQIRWHNGDVYTGAWERDVKVGYGVLIWNNGNKFEVS